MIRLRSSSPRSSRSFRPVVACALAAVVATFAASAGDLRAEDNDFFVIVNSLDAPSSADSLKYLTYGWSGWAGKTVHWRYNDANRPAGMVASASIMVGMIQAAMNKWSSACAIQFAYDGATSAAASLANSNRDGVNVIAWGSLSGNTTGVTYSSASGPSSNALAIDESDMVINYQYNPVLPATLVHEVGHMIGLRHSNVEGMVMSGPNTAPDPSTSYTGLSELQADDIAGCRALYGAPASGSGAPAPVLDATALKFPDVVVGQSSSQQTIVLTNQGTAALAISSVVLDGADFAINSATCTTGGNVQIAGVCGVSLRFVPQQAGARSGTLTILHNGSPSSSVVTLSGTAIAANAVPATRQMVEYRYAPLDYYFITSRDSDKALLDAATGWSRTGNVFLVYATQAGSNVGISRFYFDRVARNSTRGSHFYTVLASDVALLTSQNPSGSTAPGLPQNEGVDAYAYLPVVSGIAGSCATGLTPVYRLFRGAARFPDDPNHRFTTNVAVYNAFVAQGWDGEGVNFCVPSN